MEHVGITKEPNKGNLYGSSIKGGE